MRCLRLTIGVLVTSAPIALAICSPAAGAQCQRAKLTPDDGAPDDWFGYAVDVCATTAVIGAHHHDHLGRNYGAGYVFERFGAAWIQTAEIAPEGDGGFVGWSVAIDGDFIVLGAKSAWTYVFQRCEAGWIQVARLRPNDHTPGSLFGQTVALCGQRAIVGAPDDDDNGFRSGSAYVFQRDPNGAWPQVAKLLADDGEPYEHFGSALALDAHIVAVGAPEDDDLGNYAGSAYVFERDPNGNWSQTAKLLPHDGAGFWNFGTSVAVGNDLIMVGADHARGETSYSGAAYVFERDPNGVWTETAKLVASDGQTSDAFGRSVALNGDIAVIGAPWDHQTTCGSVYVFARDPSGAWSELAKLIPSDGAYHDEFGCSVSVSGTTAVIGAYKDDDQGIDSGSAYIFAVGPDDDGNGVMDPCEDCLGDLDGDQDVDLADLAELLSNYGTPQGAQYPDGDLDGDGDVDLADLSELLAHYGETCE